MKQPTGRELDALVAEKVMGLRQSHGQWRDSQHRFLQHGCPHYSTDIAAAWGVVGRLNELNWIVSIIAGTDGVEIGIRRAEEWYLGISIGEVPTAPHAICLAALRAVEFPR